MTGRAVIVTGDRKWDDGHDAVGRELKKLPKGTIVIHGDAAGADSDAHWWTRGLGLVEVRVPYISKLGRSGGPARNQKMLDILLGLEVIGYGVRVLAFHSNLADSRGTKDMVNRALKHGVVVEVFKR
jgi:hypothetical protein